MAKIPTPAQVKKAQETLKAAERAKVETEKRKAAQKEISAAKATLKKHGIK